MFGNCGDADQSHVVLACVFAASVYACKNVYSSTWNLAILNKEIQKWYMESRKNMLHFDPKMSSLSLKPFQWKLPQKKNGKLLSLFPPFFFFLTWQVGDAHYCLVRRVPLTLKICTLPAGYESRILLIGVYFRHNTVFCPVAGTKATRALWVLPPFEPSPLLRVCSMRLSGFMVSPPRGRWNRQDGKITGFRRDSAMRKYRPVERRPLLT